MKYQIVTSGTAMGKKQKLVDPKKHDTREEAQEVIEQRASEGDEAARQGRMVAEECPDEE